MRIFIAVLFLALPLFAQDATEPAALVKARADYQRDILPITKKYVAKLEALKKDLGGRGDLNGATAVQAEIDAVKPDESTNRKQLAGTWQWGSGTAVMSPDGAAQCPGNTGKWMFVKEGSYKIVWNNGVIDTLTAIDKNSFSLENNIGVRMTVQRIKSK